MLLSCVCNNVLIIIFVMNNARGQTEGDTGYDYPDYPDETYDENVISMGPVFDVDISNVTVLEGQTAVLPCKIQYLSIHRVVWIDRMHIPLTHGEYRVIDDHRFSVVRMDVNDWNLQITYVKGSDAGTYLCSVNSLPIKEKKVHLFVKVPPKIVRDQSTDDISIKEGDNITLNCSATGIPKPLITWYRRLEDELLGCVINIHVFTRNAGVVYNQSQIAESIWSYEGDHLILRNISRKCRGRIRCLASNDIPDSDEQDFMLSVQFPPEIMLPTKRLGQYVGSRETILNCVIKASPLAINFWEKNSKRLEKSPKFRVDAYPEDEFSITLSLSISDLEVDDYGDYICTASNYLGSVHDVVQLFQVKPEKSLNRMSDKVNGVTFGLITKHYHFVVPSLIDDVRSKSPQPITTGIIIFISFAYQLFI